MKWLKTGTQPFGKSELTLKPHLYCQPPVIWRFHLCGLASLELAKLKDPPQHHGLTYELHFRPRHLKTTFYISGHKFICSTSSCNFCIYSTALCSVSAGLLKGEDLLCNTWMEHLDLPSSIVTTKFFVLSLWPLHNAQVPLSAGILR